MQNEKQPQMAYVDIQHSKYLVTFGFYFRLYSHHKNTLYTHALQAILLQLEEIAHYGKRCHRN